MSKGIAILGATGSIGTSTLNVVRRLPGRFRVVALTAGGNVRKLAELVREFSPELAVVGSEEGRAALAREVADVRCACATGMDALKRAAVHPGVDIVVSAMAGGAGLVPTLAAVEAGRTVALANKEALVLGGSLVMGAAKRSGARLLPVDSEHSAIWQCLAGWDPAAVSHIILTASGGPFLRWSAERIASATAADALAHPKWHMGPKVTVDSASLMNKGLEVIEAMWLFNLRHDQVRVLVHPQSAVHSMVVYHDGSTLAQLGPRSMEVPIQHALTHPERVVSPHERYDVLSEGPLTFEEPDLARFPCLAHACRAAREGGTLPAVMSGANEAAVDGFLKGRILFGRIADIVGRVMEAHVARPVEHLDQVLEAESWARRRAVELLERGEQG